MDAVTFLLRLLLPDRPGSLGAVASAIGAAGGDILSLDVIERGPGYAVDDLIVALPPGGMADRLITAAYSVAGVTVESLRPYVGGEDLHRDLELQDEIAAQPDRALALLTENAPGVFRAGWAMALAGTTDGITVLHGSSGAPAALPPSPWLPLDSARRLTHQDGWLDERWAGGLQLAAAPLGRTDVAVVVGRPGGPQFRASEVLRLGHLAGIPGTVLAAQAGAPAL